MFDASSLDLDNFFLPSVVADPYPLFKVLRETDPVRYNPRLGGWLITRYDDNVAVMSDPRCSADRASGYRWARELSPAEQRSLDFIKSYFSNWMQGMDDPRHERQRALLHKAFSNRIVDSMRDRIKRAADLVLDGAEKTAQLELVSEYAYFIASGIIMELLGIPDEGRELVQASSKTLFELFTIVDPGPGQLERMAQSLTDAADYLRGIIDARRQQPQNDLLSAMVVAEEQGDILTAEELTRACTMLLFAGHETTTNLVSNGVYALLEQPTELLRLRRGEVSIASAVDEILRWYTPVAMSLRIAKEEITLRGKTIPAGSRIMPALSAANRDPAQFPDPDRLDLGRQHGRSLAFGYGIHFCLGAALARMSGEILIGTIINRFPNLRLASTKNDWLPNPFARTLTSLQVLL